MIVGLCVSVCVCENGMGCGVHERRGHRVRPAISPALKVHLDRALFV